MFELKRRHTIALEGTKRLRTDSKDVKGLHVRNQQEKKEETVVWREGGREGQKSAMGDWEREAGRDGEGRSGDDAINWCSASALFWVPAMNDITPLSARLPPPWEINHQSLEPWLVCH